MMTNGSKLMARVKGAVVLKGAARSRIVTSADTLGSELALHRIALFTDAVMAIAITILVLELKAPEVHSESELIPALLDLWPRYFSLLVSFGVIGVYWLEHHRQMRYICRYDSPLLLLNLLFLLAVVIVPFPTQLIGTYIMDGIAQALYAASLSFVGLTSAAMWIYAARGHRLVEPDTDKGTVRLLSLRPLLLPAAYLTVCLLVGGVDWDVAWLVSVAVPILLYLAITALHGEW